MIQRCFSAFTMKYNVVCVYVRVYIVCRGVRCVCKCVGVFRVVYNIKCAGDVWDWGWGCVH